MIIISSCLLGECCKYSGESNDCPAVHRLAEGRHVFRVCPEVTGGLPVPRPPAERLAGRIVDKSGADVTDAFLLGAERSYDLAAEKACELSEDIEFAILKARSPSCGSNVIYDGTFSGKKIVGDGCFAELLKSKGIRVLTEVEL